MGMDSQKETQKSWRLKSTRPRTSSLSEQLPALSCQAPPQSKNIDTSTFPTGTGVSFASWAEVPASPMDVMDPQRSR